MVERKVDWVFWVAQKGKKKAKKRGKEMDAFPSFEWRDDLTLIAQTERGERESDQWRERERLEDMEDKKKMLCKKEAEESREEVTYSERRIENTYKHHHLLRD